MNEIFEWFCKLSLIILIVICFNSFLGDLMFKSKYSFPKISETTIQKIDTYSEPIQITLDGKKYKEVNGEKNEYIIQLLAEYHLSGLVVAKNNNFWFRDLMRSSFDDIALMDFGVAWGDLAKDKNELYKYIKFKSRKTLGQARALSFRWKGDIPWSSGYIMTHVAHTHIIPANPNVMGGLLKVKKNNTIRLDGYLVDIYTNKNEIVARTSLSRSDNNATSRGENGRNAGGACEIMYVTQVQVGNRIYR